MVEKGVYSSLVSRFKIHARECLHIRPLAIYSVAMTIAMGIF